MFEVENVAKGIYLGGVVIKHQEHPGKSEHNEQVERDAAHAPGEAITHSIPIDFRRMKMEKNV